MSGKMLITLNDDGTVRIDSRQMKGSVAEIMKDLTALSANLDGELKVEKHVGGIHSHETGSDHVHN